jgi:hypothetical protein
MGFFIDLLLLDAASRAERRAADAAYEAEQTREQLRETARRKRNFIPYAERMAQPRKGQDLSNEWGSLYREQKDAPKPNVAQRVANFFKRK